MIEIIRTSDAKYANGADKYVRHDGRPRPILSLTHGIDNSDVSNIASIYTEAGRGAELVGILQRAGLFEDRDASAAALAAISLARSQSEAPPAPTLTDANGNGDYYVLGTGVPRVPHKLLSAAVGEAERIAGTDPGKVVRVLQQVAWRKIELQRTVLGAP